MADIASTCPAILSIIGWHAEESAEAIIRRKAADIKKAGRTIWVYQSWGAPIAAIQNFGSTHSNPVVYFLKGSAFPTRSAYEARQMSEYRTKWEPLPIAIGKVTGKLPGGGLHIGELAAADHYIDLWEYFGTLHHAAASVPTRRIDSVRCAV